MKTTISEQGWLEIPAEFRAADAIRPGQECDIERLAQGEYRVKVSPPTEAEEASLLDVLLACPVKGFFVPMERWQTTDDIEPIRFE